MAVLFFSDLVPMMLLFDLRTHLHFSPELINLVVALHGYLKLRDQWQLGGDGGGDINSVGGLEIGTVERGPLVLEDGDEGFDLIVGLGRRRGVGEDIGVWDKERRDGLALMELTNSNDGNVGSSLNQVTSDEAGSLHSPEKNVQKLKSPYVGMYFETLEEAGRYYEDYGRQEGFWTRIRSSSKSRSQSNEVTSRLFVCAHQGKHVMQTQKEDDMMDEEAKDEEEICDEQTGKKRRRSCSTVKCGCEASMRVLHDKWTNKWKVSIFSDIHNHKIVTPARRMMMKSNRHMPNAAKDLTEAFQKENLQISKVPSMFGGAQNVGFDNRDCYNHLRNVRHKELEYGDAQSVLNYFRKKQAENPQFFYAIQCDEDGRATNFFWVDSRSRTAYQYFGDVVTFDTTYRTNKYDMPFAPFTGVNHHFQSIQFGCALLQDETEVTFLWLFETWLEAMGGRHPLCIITDQDLAMKGAIAKIFPNTRHRLYIWHIKKKFGEKLSHVYYKKSDFKTSMKKCIWATYRIKDFEEQWKKLIEEHELEQKEWLQQLYEIRESWVPVYNRSTFFAGMNTTGRSEGTNAFFDDFVTSMTNLREFVVKYEQALQKIITRESSKDFTSEHKYRIVNDDDFLLKHAAQVYTRNIFEKFKSEWSRVKRLKVEEKDSDNQFHRYSVMKKTDNSKEFLVELNLQTHVGKCECQNFEFVGIICRHIMKVFVCQDIDTIPSHFILPRWRQGANKFRVMDAEALVKNDGKEQLEALRFSHMCRRATQLACYAAPSDEAYTMYMDGLD
ncbi:protein FAR1-RELATED SEQUENCE 5-like [Rosa chinensis]|uniref:protein FAR1-RELATED SEQUENCE 5-like n=1 Tax=Rosa chinensis TaxID=74649 RepID=UPI000D08E231|nr:protein FAR1-RELATED SEQUENCE 5-like [Rosa chinensis]